MIAVTPPIDLLTDISVIRMGAVALTKAPGIDIGEALLTTVAQHVSDPNLLITGDKKFIEALRRHFPAIYAELRDRIWSFEQCLLAICDARGASYVIARVRPAAGCDKMFRSALGSGDTVDETSFTDAIRSFRLPP